MTQRIQRLAAAGAFLLAAATPVRAHVKWFVDASFGNAPLSFSEAVTPTFLALLALSLVTISLLVLAEERLTGARWYGSVNGWLSARQNQSDVVMRVAAAAVLLMNWQAGAMLVPEFTVQNAAIGWFQFLLALLLLFPTSTPIAGAGMIALYLYAVSRFGLFHMLDYLHYPGVGLFLALNRAPARVRALQIPVLYSSIGFSLCWVGLEKIVYPEWGLILLREHPQLALGFPIEFFLTGAAFVEISLGFLLILGVLERPLAATITLVFFLTTLVFGKTEVIGHTLLHGALIVFLLRGTGEMYRPPIAFHKSLPLRIAFGSVNFGVLVFALLFAYTGVAGVLHDDYEGPAAHSHERLDVSGEPSVPEIEVTLTPDTDPGWNAHLDVRNFRFAPEHAGGPHTMGEGHVHVEIDGVKLARWYGEWGHIPALSRGSHEIRFSLNTNDHHEYAVGETSIDWRTTLTVEDR